MSAEAPQPHASGPELTSAGPELMAAGPGRPPVRRRTAVVLVALVVLAAGSVAGWRIHDRVTDLVTQAELQQSYDGMLTTDGRASTGTLSAESARQRTDQPQTSPAQCAPVTDATVRHAFPTAAVDGLVSYQGGSMDFATGLLSFRFADRAGARAEFDRVASAVAACAGAELTISEPWDTTLRLDRLDTDVPQAEAHLDVRLAPNASRASQAAYRPSYELTVARYKNVLSWQYSYRSGQGQPDPDHQLLDTLSRRIADVDSGRGEPGSGDAAAPTPGR